LNGGRFHFRQKNIKKNILSKATFLLIPVTLLPEQ
jgi:hypothetical protein